MIATVNTAPGIHCEATAPTFQHQCPVKDETDHGSLTVAWTTTEVTVELHSLAAYLDTWAEAAATHEEVCRTVARTIENAGVTDVTVTYRGETAGLTLTIGGGSDVVPSKSVRR